jgi:hypothetical protein
VDRSKSEQRDILSIVLNESLTTAPKLTQSQLAVLAVVFLFRYTQSYMVGNHQLLGEYLDAHVAPFASKLVKNMACYQHLEFTGCGAIGIGQMSLESILARTYRGQFLKGFDENAVTSSGLSLASHGEFFIECLNDPSKLQVRANSQELLEKILEQRSIKTEDRQKIISLFNTNAMSEQEIRDKVIQIRPFMDDVFKIWSDSAMRNFTLTSVGIAIGHGRRVCQS